jgi:hypothetical protein
VRRVPVTPNEIEVEVDGRGGWVAINQNYDRNWKLRGGGEDDVRPVAGRIAFLAQAGRRTVEVVYRPRSFFIGAGLTSLVLLAMAAGWRR